MGLSAPDSASRLTRRFRKYWLGQRGTQSSKFLGVPERSLLKHLYSCLCSSVGRPKHVRVMAGALEGDIFIGPKAEVRKPIYCTSPYISVCCC